MSRFPWKRQRDEAELDGVLRTHRPEPSEEFVRTYATRFRAQGVRAEWRRLLVPRLAFSGAITTAALVALGLSGGFHEAKATAIGVYRAAASFSTTSSPTAAPTAESPNSHQYGARCGQDPPKKDPGDARARCPITGAPGRQNEGNSGTRGLSTAVVIVDYTPLNTVTVSYKTVDGSATAGSDYKAVSGTVSFAAGETAKTIGIPVYGDTKKEKDETVQVVLFNPSVNGEIVGSGTATIVNDD